MARILLIDDDDAVRTALRLMLVHFGHTVIEANNGKEGLRIYSADGADLLIADILMPEKDGLEVLISLRKTNPSLKIIAISGGSHQSPTNILRAARFLGASRVLAKPFSSDVLKTAVDELLLQAVTPLGKNLPMEIRSG